MGRKSSIACSPPSARSGGQALGSHEVVVNLIGATTTRTRLRVRAGLDTNPYQAGRHIPDDELETIYLRKDPFHGEGTTR